MFQSLVRSFTHDFRARACVCVWLVLVRYSESNRWTNRNLTRIYYIVFKNKCQAGRFRHNIEEVINIYTSQSEVRVLILDGKKNNIQTRA